MEEALLNIVVTINSYLSNYVLIILLIGAGLYFTIRTRFVQIRCFGEGWKRVFGGFSLFGKKEKSGMSSFQALTTAIAAQVGTGNIVGACGAILIGGPGAIFWMWLIAFLGMATNYAEAVLAQKTRIVDSEGIVHGGPVYYIRTAFRGGSVSSSRASSRSRLSSHLASWAAWCSQTPSLRPAKLLSASLHGYGASRLLRSLLTCSSAALDVWQSLRRRSFQSWRSST